MHRKVIVILVSVLLFTPVFIVDTADPSVTTSSNSEYPYPGDDWAWKMVGADLAHDLGETGEGTTVAVLDTGIDYTHPDLKDKMWSGTGYDFVNDNDDPMDEDGHGTHVAGIVASVAPDAKLMALKVIEEKGGRWQDVSKALRYARDNGADIISMSFGTAQSPMGRAFKIQLNKTYSDGLYLSAAAGNNATDSKAYPAAYDSTAAVSAVDHEKTKSGYSNYGDWLDLTAPGGDTEMGILSTLPGEDYGSYVGTSMAAPFVSGVAAIMMGADPGLTGQQVRSRINNQAVDLGNTEFYGHGLVNAYRAAGGEVPSHPENVRGSSGNESVDLRWDPPRFNGTATVDGYNLYRSSDSGSGLIAELSPGSVEYTDTNVTNEVTYTYEVSATSEVGESSFSTPISLTPRESPVEPAKIRDLQLVSEESPVEIRWSESMDDGGSPITHYNVFRDGEQIEETGGTSYTDPEAVGNVTYTVSASNDIGEGETSDPLNVSVEGEASDGGPSEEDTDEPIGTVFADWWIPAIIVGLLVISVIVLGVYLKNRKPRY